MKRNRFTALVATLVMALALLPGVSSADEDACDSIPRDVFVDVSPGNVHAWNIDCVAAYGITQGVGGGRYNPGGDVTRAQMATFLTNVVEAVTGEEQTPSGDSPFTDIAGTTHENNIEIVYDLGIASGTSADTFSPDSNVRRDQMATFLVNTYETLGIDWTDSPTEPFTDVGGNTHELNINRLADAALVSGTSATEYSPRNNTRRDQMATNLSDVIRNTLVGDEPDPDPTPDPEPSDWDVSNVGDREWYQANTGPRDFDDSDLSIHDGRLNVRDDGAVVENLRVDGPLHIIGDDITVRNVVVNGTLNLRNSEGALVEDTIVRGGTPYPINASDARGWVVQYTEVDGRERTSNNGGLYGGNGTVRYSEFYGHTDSAKVGSNSVWEYNYLHGNGTWGTDAHVDGLQSTGSSNVEVFGNYIDMPIDDGANSAIIAQSNFGSLRNWTVEHNYLNGGNYTVYFREKGHGPPENIVVENNRFGRDYRYGLFSVGGDITRDGNVWHDTGEPLGGGSTEPDEDDEVVLAHGTELDRSDTGLPDGWSGEPSGAVTTTSDGEVVENLKVTVDSGPAITVEHDDVVVRYNQVNHRSGANGVVVSSSASNVTVEHNDFEGHYRTESGNHGSIGVLTRGDNVTVQRNHFQGGRDGVHLYGTNSEAVENWVTDLHRHSGAHNDSFVYGGRVDTYADNTIARNRAIAGNSGGIDLYAMYGPVQGVNIFDNLVVGEGRGWGIYGGYVQPLDGPNYHHDNRDIRIEGNRFEGEFGWPDSRGEGSNAAVNTDQPGNTYEDNRWVGGGTDLQARCGVRQNNCES